jgi:hypothetical protein
MNPVVGTVIDPMSGGKGFKPGGIIPKQPRDQMRNFLNGIPFVGGMFKGLLGDPEHEAMQRAMAEAKEVLTRERAFSMQGNVNAMNQGALAFGPRNEMLGEMMGKGPGQNAMDLGPMLQNPMPMGQQEEIRAAAFGAPEQPKPHPMSRAEQAIRGVGQFKGARR